LAALHGTSATVSPVIIEFLAGTTSANELMLARAYLDVFVVIDHQQTPPQDWQEAQRLAQRVPRDGRRRQLGDCLIRAIANRLKHEVISYDQGFV
jgi:predicted nucleic acid-binding protein